MSDVKKLEERMGNLESKLKVAFHDIETKISSLSMADKEGIEERFQEVEDLILIIQVEQMKIKEKMIASADIGFGETNMPTEDIEKLKPVVESLQNMLRDIDMRLSELENNKPNVVAHSHEREYVQQSSNLLLEINKIINSN